MSKENQNINNTVVVSLSPAQKASGAHNGITPAPMELIKKIFLEGYVDDHRGWFGVIDTTVYQPNVVIVRTDLRNGATEVCFACDKNSFSINPFYVSEEDGKVHLSVWSIGGTIRRNGCLEEEVAKNNTEAIENKYVMHEILTVIRKENFMKTIVES